MKRLTLILGAAAVAAISAPVSSAQAQGCSWWDVACRGMTNVVGDGGWHIAGRDANGNVLYVRQRVDQYGNVIYDQSRRNDYGRYLVLNTRTNRKGTYYGANGATCKYHENPSGYHENCKYAKVNKAYKASKTKYKPTKYRPITYRPVEYKPVKYQPVRSKTSKGNAYGVTKGHEGKDVLKGHNKGPKH